MLQQTLSAGAVPMLFIPGTASTADCSNGVSLPAVQALQALEVGDKQLPPVQLGAGAVLQSTVVRTLPTHQQTEWWVRSSLNQRLLGYRLAVIASRAQQQLGKHYHPGAALLSPQQQLQPLVKAVKGCDVLRFDLTVPQPDAVAPGPASGARAAAAAMAMASQGFNKLAAKLPMVPRLPSFAPGGSGAASSSNGGAAGGVAPTAAAAGVPAPSAFAWPEDSTAAAASGPASSSSRRRVAPIRESPGGPDAESAGDVMSPASSGLLSPLANSDDATADWWNPVEGWTGPGNQAEATRRSSSSSSGAPLPHETAATAASGDGSGSSNSRPPSVGAAAAGGIGRQAPSAAVQQLEQQLSQTLAAPLPALLVRTRRSTGECLPAVGGMDQRLHRGMEDCTCTAHCAGFGLSLLVLQCGPQLVIHQTDDWLWVVWWRGFAPCGGHQCLMTTQQDAHPLPSQM
jgi:hypothetical protein